MRTNFTRFKALKRGARSAVIPAVPVFPLCVIALLCSLRSFAVLAQRGAVDNKIEFSRLAHIDVWLSVSAIIGFRSRIWLANSWKFVNHKSADLYSFDHSTGQARYERHLMSQEAGDTVLAGNVLYWPFEDSRLSRSIGEFALTDGNNWAWLDLAPAFNFYVHAMSVLNGDLYAATFAWQAGLQRSRDGGRSWDIVYTHPTLDSTVSWFTRLATFRGKVYAGLTSRRQIGA